MFKLNKSLILLLFLCILGCNKSIAGDLFDDTIKKNAQFPWQAFSQALHSSRLHSEMGNAKISPLKGGFSSDGLFKINLDGKDYVLRFMGKAHSLKQRKIISQSFVWASMNGLGPKTYFIDHDNFSFILSKFEEGKTLSLKDTKNSKIIQLIGNILSRTHKASPPKKNYQEFTQFTFGQKWYQAAIVDKNKIIGPSILKEAYGRWLKINNQTKSLIKKSMLHNDPNLRNILLNHDQIILLDWELAGIGDPRKEIAHVCAWYGLNDKLTHTLLLAYYGREPTHEELKVLQQLKKEILLEFAWVGLSSLKKDLDQKTWDECYNKANPETIEALSLIQMKSEKKPSDEVTRGIFLGLIKQFMMETTRN